MKLTRLQPHHRIRIGRNIMLTAAAAYCLTRAWAYLPHAYPRNTGAIDLVSAQGSVAWVWAGAWAVAGILCVIDMVNRHTRYGISLMVGLAFVWGVSYGLSWAVSGFTSRDWLTAVTYMGPAVIVFGMLLKITALQDSLNPAGQEDTKHDRTTH